MKHAGHYPLFSGNRALPLHWPRFLSDSDVSHPVAYTIPRDASPGRVARYPPSQAQGTLGTLDECAMYVLRNGGRRVRSAFQSGDHKPWPRIKWLFAIPVYCRRHGKVLLWAHRPTAIIVIFRLQIASARLHTETFMHTTRSGSCPVPEPGCASC